MTIPLEPSVQPDKFLFDYKILIFALVVLILSIVLAFKKKSWRKAMITLGASSVVTTIGYVYNRIYETSKYGYRYFFETNKSFDELVSFVINMVVFFFVVFLGEKVIERIRGGK